MPLTRNITYKFQPIDKKFPLRLKGKFYRTAIRPAMLYGSECCPTRVALVRKFEIAEMRMLRWMCDGMMLDRIPNRDIGRS